MSMRHARAALLAVATLALPATADATTATISVEEGGSFTATSSAVTFEASGITIRCAVTLGGTLNAEFEETRGARAGSVSSVSWSSCSGGSVERALSLPWTLSYDHMVGSEPEVATAQLLTLPVAVSFSTFGGIVRCLYSGDLGVGLDLTGENPWTTEQATLLGASLPLSSGSFGCPITAAVIGTLALDQPRKVKAQKALVQVLNPSGLAADWLFPQSAEGEEGTFLVKNVSGANLAINRMLIERPGEKFSLPAAQNTCIRVPTVVLANNATCQFNIAYSGGAANPNHMLVKSSGYIVGKIGIGTR